MNWIFQEFLKSNHSNEIRSNQIIQFHDQNPKWNNQIPKSKIKNSKIKIKMKFNSMTQIPNEIIKMKWIILDEDEMNYVRPFLSDDGDGLFFHVAEADEPLLQQLDHQPSHVIPRPTRWRRLRHQQQLPRRENRQNRRRRRWRRLRRWRQREHPTPELRPRFNHTSGHHFRLEHTCNPSIIFNWITLFLIEFINQVNQNKF